MKKNKIEHYSAKEALDFHSSGKPGKIEITPSKPMTTKRDLALAYSPGVASPVIEIGKDVNKAYVKIQKKGRGAFNIIDLANINSCSFLATDDYGSVKEDFFEIYGRIDESDIRGCNQMLL